MKLPKKYDHLESEKKWQKLWEDEKIYQFDEKSDKPIYSVDTPPPYVSADHLHQGHIMSYSQAEFIVRYKRMQGFNVYYPMGFDDNGLPTERFVEKKYKVNKKNISRPDFIKLCLKETKKGAETYRKLWTDLGISVDWSKTYSTINPLCQKRSQWSFLDLYKKGKIYRANKPILWCTTCQTAIAQADLEPEERKTKLVHIKVKIKDTDEDLVFATTRPELLPACMGISVNPEDKRYKHLIGKKVIMPLTNAEVELTADKEGVNPEYGSGIVYFCSYGGGECIEWLSRHKDAKPIHILTSNGKFNEKAGDYEGLSMGEARKKIIEDLEKAGALEKIEKLNNVTHVHERCGTDVEYIPTKQWFIKLLDDKDNFLKFGEKLNWYPESMHKKYIDWVESLKWDWCISRQLYYGVPFPLWHCKKCKEIILPDEKDLPIDPSIDKPKNICPKCKSSEIEPEPDVMDTWMTSSMTPYIIKDLIENDKVFPNGLRPQGFDIIRTWLFYSVVKAYFHNESIPFEDVMISGHGLDQHGRKISKRLGNYVDPNKIIEQYGADSMRYWSCGANLGSNLRFQEEEVKEGKKLLNKLFNVSKFCLMHLENKRPPMSLKDIGGLDQSGLKPIDKWILTKLQKTIKECTEAFDTYEYSRVKNILYDFFWKDLADNYLEIAKYRLYSEDKKDSESKKSAQYTLYQCLLTIIKLWAPLLPHITEEIWQAYFKDTEDDKSVHISSWPEVEKDLIDKDNEKLGDLAVSILSHVRKEKSDNNISLAKEIKEVIIDSKEKELEKFFEDLKETTKAGKVEFGEGDKEISENLKIKVSL
ncbi:MAG: valine--tRNA ligase [Parcubacteria group bacterium]|nr:valine--tRNA ligase [Parcubacteria group bacterium]